GWTWPSTSTASGLGSLISRVLDAGETPAPPLHLGGGNLFGIVPRPSHGRTFLPAAEFLYRSCSAPSNRDGIIGENRERTRVVSEEHRLRSVAGRGPGPFHPTIAIEIVIEILAAPQHFPPAEQPIGNRANQRGGAEIQFDIDPALKFRVVVGRGSLGSFEDVMSGLLATLAGVHVVPFVAVEIE